MRQLLGMLFGLALVTQAHAFDAIQAVQEWTAANSTCRMEADEVSCGIRDKLTKEFLKHGLCFDREEYEWRECAGS